MEESFLKDRLLEKHGVTCIVPEDEDRASVHRIIYEELIRGKVYEDSRDIYWGVVDRLAYAGAQGVILGCTEIGMLLKQEDSPLPLFDTTELHAAAAVKAALA